jgi:hypothetical protein
MEAADVADTPSPLRPNRRLRGQGAFISLSPTDPVLLVGGVVIPQARLVFSDLSGLDVTEDVVWTCSAPAVAQLEPGPGRRSRLVGRAPGVAKLFATAGGTMGWTTVTVLGWSDR